MGDEMMNSRIEDIKKDFELLIKDGNVGFYNRCEVIEIFGIRDNIFFNIFTIAIFESSEIIKDQEKFLTKKIREFSKINNVKWGIKRSIINLKDSKNFFVNLIEKNEFKLNAKILEISTIFFQQKKYIPSDHILKNIQVNQILKNNFSNGSYIIEGFDLEKKELEFLKENPVLLNKFSEEVSEIIPIKIGSVSDRLGNIIFQFPITIVEIGKNVIKPDKGLEIDFFYNDKLEDIPALKVIMINQFDDNILDMKIQEVNKEKKIKIEMSISNIVEMKILNSNNLILYSDIFNTIKRMETAINILNEQKRVFKIRDEIIKVPNSELVKIKAIGEIQNLDNFINSRMYERDLLSLEHNKQFIQYHRDEHEKSLKDLRTLISQYSENGVYLWDPFLSALDIKETLYFTPHSNVPLRAITNLKKSENFFKNEKLKKNLKSRNIKIKKLKRKISRNYYRIKDIENYIKEFKKDKKEYLFLDLEVRTKWENYGQDFHDRFIIFPLEKPKVWSLGTSINSLGKSHHILQEVKNAQHILNTFNKLWDELNRGECIVWKSMG